MAAIERAQMKVKVEGKGGYRQAAKQTQEEKRIGRIRRRQSL